MANTNIKDTKIDGKIQFVKTNEANSRVNLTMLANSNIKNLESNGVGKKRNNVARQSSDEERKDSSTFKRQRLYRN